MLNYLQNNNKASNRENLIVLDDNLNEKQLCFLSVFCQNLFNLDPDNFLKSLKF